MDEQEIKTEIERFRKIVIDEVDEYLREYIVMDMLDAGEANYLIDDYSWYFYWLDVTKELTYLMNYLIGEHYEGKAHYRKYINECVALRQVVDNELMKNPHFNSEEVSVEMSGEIYVGKEVESEQDFINILGDDKHRELIINELHKSLSNKGLVNIGISEFSNHFKTTNTGKDKIRWYGTEPQITALFYTLIRKGIIDRSYENRIPSTIPIHFINKKGNEFKDKQLRVPLSKVRSGEVDQAGYRNANRGTGKWLARKVIN